LQFEVGAGLVPDGGPMARLSRLIGRGRALEVILSADDVPADLAELYGYVNRSLSDADLDGFVDALATRIAAFDKRTILDTKRLVNVASLPPDIEIESGWNACLAVPGSQALAEKLGIEKLNLQILRRTMATQAQRMGSVKDIQVHPRHARPDTTAYEYRQELPDSVQEMVGSMNPMPKKGGNSKKGVVRLLWGRRE